MMRGVVKVYAGGERPVSPKVFADGERLVISLGGVINGRESYVDIGHITDTSMTFDREGGCMDMITLSVRAMGYSLHDDLDLRDINRSVAERLTVRELFGVIDKKIEGRDEY